MDAHQADFVFRDSLTELRQSDDFVACVPDGITTRDQLFMALRRELNLPSYFGGNWDALADCLRDLSWIDSHLVIVAHEAIPNVDAATLRTYLDVLAECVRDWKPEEQHQLLVVFPERAQAEICGIIQGGSVAP